MIDIGRLFNTVNAAVLMLIPLTWTSWHWTANLTTACSPWSLFPAELEIHKYSFNQGSLDLSRNLGRMKNNRLRNILLCKSYPGTWFGVRRKLLSFVVPEVFLWFPVVTLGRFLFSEQISRHKIGLLLVFFIYFSLFLIAES